MSGSNERHDENYKYHNENEMNRSTLPMTINNQNI